MPKEFILPDLGEGIHEGEIIDVLISVGDAVEDGQPIMIIETDKATAEIPSPVTGTVEEIRVKPGETVKVGDVLAVFNLEGEISEKKKRTAGSEKAMKTTRTEKAEAPSQPAPATPTERGPVPASPSTRHLARELGVNLNDIPPTGPGGQVTAEDVRAFATRGKKTPAPETPSEETAKETGLPPTPMAPAPLSDFSQWGPVERIPLRSVRRSTARHMALAWSQIPHVTHSDVADITALESYRRKHKDEVAAKGGTLSLTVFALKAVVAALKEYAQFNSSLDPDSEEIVLKRYYHIGVAADTDRGLIVPVIRDVDRKSISELSKELSVTVNRAREGKLGREELVGGTFTVTNIGALGGTGLTPIVNHPQVAILGMGQARMQPVVQGDERSFKIAPRLLLPLVVSFDHRVVDGADAARFLNLIIGLLGDTERLLMMV